MPSRLFFNGRLYTTPSTVSAVEDGAMAPRNPATGNNLGLVGSSDGGQPGVVMTFGSPVEAKAVLRGGDLLVAVNKAFAPSAATGAPNKVSCVRVEKATRSTLTLNDGATTPTAAIVLTSDVYGLPANAIRVKVEAGTLSGRKLTTQLDQQYYTGDNIGRAAFTVDYTGAGASATATVSNTSLVLAAPTGTTVATIAFADAPTVQQVVDRINAVAGFSASAVPGSELTATLNALDAAAAVDCKTAPATVRADLQAAIEWFNSSAEGYVTAARATGASAPPAVLPFTYLAGATAPAPVISDWTDALGVLQTADVQWFVPLSGLAAVHSAADAHAVYMSSAGRRERRCVVGPAAGTSIDAVKALPAALNSDRTAMAWPGHYDYDANGNLVVLPAYFTAVLVAAGFAGISPGVSMTNTALRMQGLEYIARNPVDTDDLISAGVLVIESAADGYKVCRSNTTWLANDNYNRVELSCGAAVDFVVRSVRDRLDVLRGQQATPRNLARARSIAESALIDLAKPAPAGPGVIVGDGASPAYANIVADLVGDSIGVSFQCSPVIPLNFVTLAVAVVPYAGSTAAAA